MSQADAIDRSWASTPSPKRAPPTLTVKAWVPPASAMAYARIIQARCRAISRRRMAANPSTMLATIAALNASRDR